jgi:hypothetical protein
MRILLHMETSTSMYRQTSLQQISWELPIPFLRRKKEQAAEFLRETCLTVTVMFATATAYGLVELSLTFTQQFFP